MMISAFNNFALLILFFFLFACDSGIDNSEERVLARVFDEYLYESDITGIIPENTTVRDSIEIVRNYIDNWIQQRLVLTKAMNNLTPEQMNFDKQLEEYRKSLIIYEYETKLIKHKLDTIVTDQDVEEYYDQFQSNFELKDNIVKCLFVKIESDSRYRNIIKRLLRSDKEEDKIKLEAYCRDHAANFFLDDQSWLLFDDLLKEIPIKTYNQEAYLQNHRYIEIGQSHYVYMVLFKDFKIKESLSPLSFERDNIRNIIINKRKVELIKNMEKEAMMNAVENNDFEIY
jgi:hypothetical protein